MLRDAMRAWSGEVDGSTVAIYGRRMPGRQKTTVYLEPEDYLRLKRIAQERGETPAALIREAVAEYGRRHGGRTLPRSLGAGRSGLGDLGERAEQMLTGLGEAPERPPR